MTSCKPITVTIHVSIMTPEEQLGLLPTTRKLAQALDFDDVTFARSKTS